MRELLVRAVLAIVSATGGAAIAAAAAPDPVIGTWQLNVSKSTFTPGPALKSETRTYSQSAQGITVTTKTVGADGKEDTVRSTYQLDGKDYPVAGTDYDSLSASHADTSTATFRLHEAGKAVRTLRR